MKRYLILLTVFSGLVALLLWATGTYVLPGKVDSVSWGLFFYFLAVTLVFHLGLVSASRGRPQVFVRYYMASTTIRMLMHIGVIFVYSFLHKTDAVRFIITCLALYLLFTMFEAGMTWNDFRKNQGG
ncbi:MAG: hypothetical protein IT242_02690 [Bacteroidia bacterium]|nr:hypothetical protein [Bacteroidia bacterium]